MLHCVLVATELRFPLCFSRPDMGRCRSFANFCVHNQLSSQPVYERLHHILHIAHDHVGVLVKRLAGEPRDVGKALVRDPPSPPTFTRHRQTSLPSLRRVDLDPSETFSTSYSSRCNSCNFAYSLRRLFIATAPTYYVRSAHQQLVRRVPHEAKHTDELVVVTPLS